MVYADASSSIWHLQHTAGQTLNQYGAQSTWTHRCADIGEGGARSGPLQEIDMFTDVNTPGGQTWDIYYADMTITSADGTVRQVNLDAATPNGFGGQHWTQPPVAYPEDVQSYQDPTQGVAAASMHFFLADHLGTTQMELSAAGYPVWQGQFLCK